MRKCYKILTLFYDQHKLSIGHETAGRSFARTEFGHQASESVDSGDMSQLSQSASVEPQNGGRRHSLNPVNIPEFLRRVSIGPMMSRRLSLRHPRRKSRSAKTSREEIAGAMGSNSQPHLNQIMKRQISTNIKNNNYC